MTPDQVGYQAAAARLAQAEGSAMQVRVQQSANVRAQVYAVLTPTQKAKLADHAHRAPGTSRAVEIVQGAASGRRAERIVSRMIGQRVT